MLDYLAKTAFKQSQLLQEMKGEIQNLADGQKGLQLQLEKNSRERRYKYRSV